MFRLKYIMTYLLGIWFFFYKAIQWILQVWTVLLYRVYDISSHDIQMKKIKDLSECYTIFLYSYIMTFESPNSFTIWGFVYVSTNNVHTRKWHCLKHFIYCYVYTRKKFGLNGVSHEDGLWWRFQFWCMMQCLGGWRTARHWAMQ